MSPEKLGMTQTHLLSLSLSKLKFNRNETNSRQKCPLPFGTVMTSLEGFNSKQPQNLLFTNEELTCLISSTTEERKLIYEGQIILPHIMKFLILLYTQ